MKCNKCGYNNEGGSAFCERCGAPLNNNRNFCQQCGAVLEGDEDFCPFCGETILHNTGNMQKAQEVKKYSNHKAIIITAVIVLGVCILAFIIWNCINNEEQTKNQKQLQTEENAEINNNISTSEQEERKAEDDYLKDKDEYVTYGEDYCHTFYFDANGGISNMDAIDVYEGEEFSIPSYTPEKQGYSFVGWQVKRLADNKYYYTSTYSWMDISEGDAQGYSPSLYRPKQIILLDDSWKKGNVNNSNYVFIAVWR